MDQKFITLLTFGHFERKFLEDVSEIIMPRFRLPVNIREGRAELGEYYDAARRQYNGNLLLNTVESMAQPASLRTIGCFNVDLFIPILTFIFGQAYLNGTAGIVSLYRLNNQLYGMDNDMPTLSMRFAKEIIHELGHTFGLLHCHSPGCIMLSGNYVEDIDQKEPDFCPGCSAMLDANIRNLLK